MSHCRNRYIVECKVASVLIHQIGALVEIDTLWNVKHNYEHVRFIDGDVEIDTLWNVKIEAKVVFVNGVGRNRYIVECKESIAPMLASARACRNRYIVECKVPCLLSSEQGSVVEIDTLWNVKKEQRNCISE